MAKANIPATTAQALSLATSAIVEVDLKAGSEHQVFFDGYRVFADNDGDLVIREVGTGCTFYLHKRNAIILRDMINAYEEAGLLA